MNYDLGTGYFSRPGHGAEQFFRIWWENTMKYAKPHRVIVTACGGSKIDGAPGQWITLDGDLGFIGQILSGEKKYPLPSCGVEICAQAMLAYLDERDFIFKEQDLLAFGPWVERLYAEIGDMGLIMGRQKCMPCAPSLMLIRHWFIPEYVRWYMGSEAENTADTVMESKIERLAKQMPDKVGYHSFGCDRDRPIPLDDEVFYAQKLNQDELREMMRRGLISETSLDGDVKRFTND